MSAKLSFHNWVFEQLESIAFTSAEWLATPDELAREQLGIKAISDEIEPADRTFTIEFDAGYPVDVVAILNHNIKNLASGTAITVTLTDSSENTLVVNPTLNNAKYLQSYIVFDVADAGSFDSSDVYKIQFQFDDNVQSGQVNYFTNTLDKEPLTIGSIWAGPIWQPASGFRGRGATGGVTENQRNRISQGGQIYTIVEPKARIYQLEFPNIQKSEVFGFDVSSPTLEQVQAFAGTTRPILVMPSDLYPCYGYIQDEIRWSLIEGTNYTSDFFIREGL